MAKIFYDKVRLGFGQSLIIGNRPDSLDLDKLCTIRPDDSKDVEQFGLFEYATPNFQTYYPEVKPEDLVPKDGEFVKPVFRALSEVIVHKRTNPIDFTANGILRASMKKLVGQSVYPNHEAIVGNEVGVVSNVQWQEAYKTSSGITVPAGINAEMTIDGKSHPKIARSIMMTPPAIHSNSVTVEFAWEKSHPKLTDEEFRSMLGKSGADRKLVRRVVTDIARYHETSLVAHGADPFAQVIKDGQITNPGYADSIYNFSEGKATKNNYYFFDFKDSASLSESSTLSDSNNTNSERDMNQLITKLAAIFKTTEDEITEAFIEGKFNALSQEASKVESLTTELSTEKGKVTQLTTDLETEKAKTIQLTSDNNKLTSAATIGDAHTVSTREEVTRLYSLIKEGKTDETMLSVIKEAKYEALSAFQKDFEAQLQKLYPGTCKDCGGHNVARNSSQGGEGDGSGQGTTTKTSAQVASEIRKENFGKSILTHKK